MTKNSIILTIDNQAPFHKPEEKYSSTNMFANCHDFSLVTENVLTHGFTAHTHSYVEIVLVISGNADHYVDNKVFSVKRGNTFIIPKDCVHAFHNTSKDFSVRNIMFEPENAGLQIEELRVMPGYQALFVLEPTYRHSFNDFESFLELNEMQLMQIKAVSEKIRDELYHRQSGYESLIRSYLNEIIVSLARYYEMNMKSGNDRISKLGDTLAFMERNALKQISLDELAERAYMSKRHFIRIFKEVYDSPPGEYLIKLRLEVAAKLLHQNDDIPVGEIAAKCGFQDSNYFSRQFRKHYNCPPRDYRKRIR